MTGLDRDLASALPDTTGVERNEIIVWAVQQTGFLSAVRETGANVIAIGQSADDLKTAIGPRTAAVLWFAGTLFAEETIPLETIISIAHARDVPVIVDAADQIPPFSALSTYTRDAGADLAIFSGGKGLLGPQASGLIVGRKGLVASCRVNAGPQHSIGRPAKVGKEEMAGLLAAIELAKCTDEAAVYADWLRTVQQWKSALEGIDGIAPKIVDRSHSGQPVPRLIVSLAPGTFVSEAVIEALWDCNPRIAVLPEGTHAIALNPQMVIPADRQAVGAAAREVFLRRP